MKQRNSKPINAVTTPVRRVVASSRKRAAPPSATPQRLRLRKMTSTPMQTPDRFIPNRSAMNMSRASASLIKQRRAMPAVEEPQQKQEASKRHYSSELRRALFGTTEEEPPIMAFGSKPSKQSGVSSSSQHQFFEQNDPRRQDVLRSSATMNEEEERQEQQRRRHRELVSMTLTKALDAPNMLPYYNLTLVDSGKDAMAVALDNTVYLMRDGRVDLLARDDCYHFSCVSWSNDGKYLALGTEAGVIIFCPEERQNVPLFELFEYHSGHVTAIAWNGLEIAAACENGITRYDLRKDDGEEENDDRLVQATYLDHYEHNVTNLQWSGNIIASSDTCTGEILLWDAKKNGCEIPPEKIMNHDNVKCLEVNPRQPNILVSAGEGGLKFWNLPSGKLRAEIAIEDDARKTICSKHRDEILVAHGENTLSLWTLGPQKVEKRMEYTTNGGRINGLTRGYEDGTIVCNHGDETLSVHSFQREVTKEKARATLGLLKMPTVR